MKEVQNEKEMTRLIEDLVKKVINNVLRNSSNNIRTGTVLSVNPNSRTASISVNSTGLVLANIKYQLGVADGVTVGTPCLLISPDPALNNQIKAIVY